MQFASGVVIAGALVAGLGAAQMVMARDAAGNCRMRLVWGSQPRSITGTHCEGGCTVGACKFVKGPQARFRSPPLWTCGCADGAVDVTGECDGTVTAGGDPNADPGSINTATCNGTCENMDEHCDHVGKVMTPPGPNGWTANALCGCVKGKSSGG